MPPPPVRKRRREGGRGRGRGRQRLEGRYVRGVCVCVCVSRCVSMQQKKTLVYKCSVCLCLSPTRASTHTRTGTGKKKRRHWVGIPSRLAAGHIHHTHTINPRWHKKVPSQEGSAQDQLVSTGRHFDAPERKGLACQNDAHSRYNLEVWSTCLFAI
jgi:hypothetical protein